MPRRLGPVLHFRGARDDAWAVGALALFAPGDTAPQLAWRASGDDPWQPVTAFVLRSDSRGRVVRYEWEIPRVAEAREVAYRLGEEGPWSLHVPARGAPPHMAFASCNGFSDPKHRTDDLNERWRHLLRTHEERPFHLLLLGGDQIYADPLWTAVVELEDWSALPLERRADRGFTRTMRRRTERFYTDLYRRRWSQQEPAEVWSRVPMLATWDDHDIFDGWGSYDPELQQSEVYQGIYEVAREHFSLFQLQTRPGEAPPGAFPGQGGTSFGHRLGNLALLFLDTRSERSVERVLGAASWEAVFRWLDGLRAEGAEPPPRHLLVVTAVPLAYPRLRWLETIAGWDFRHERKRLEDDLRDHWSSAGHHGERLRLVHRLLDFACRARCRVTVLSGDVHVAAMGVLESRRGRRDAERHANVITQLVSSPVVHPPPGGFVRWALDRMARGEDEIDRDLWLRMLEIPGAERHVENRRNWLELEPEDGDQPRIWAHWHFEGAPDARHTKVVHAVGDDRSG